MKIFLLIVNIVAVAHPLFAHQVDVIARRTLDDKSLKPDSIRVECAELGIKFTTTDTLFTLSDPTSVHADDISVTTFGPSNIYDITGRLLAQTESSSTVIGLSWIDQYGLVYVVPTSTTYTSAGKGRAEISSVVEVTLTLWRAGYDSAKTVFEFPTTDTTVNVLLELLPWWKRIHYAKLDVYVPLAGYTYTYLTSQNGGTVTKDSKPRAYGFAAWSGVPTNPKPDMPLNWTIDDTSARYRYDNPLGYVYEYQNAGFFVIDTSSGEVDSLSLGWNKTTNSSVRSSQAVVHNLPKWDTVSAGLLDLQIVDSLANTCLVAVDYFDKKWDTTQRPWWDEETHVFRHVPSDTGISIRCRVFLKE